MTIDLTRIILAVITLIFGLLARYVIPNLKAKTSAQQMEIIRLAVRTVVYGVEQLYRSTPGQEKKKMVIEELARQGYILDVDNIEKTMDMLIEEAVKELNIEQKEHING